MAFQFNFEIVKKHPYAFVGGALGLFIVLYLLLRNSGGSSSAGASSSGGGATPLTGAQQVQVDALNAQAGVQSAQVQGAVDVASAQAAVANNQTEAALQANELQTAASLQLGSEQVNAQIAETLGAQATTVKTAQIQSNTELGTAAISSSTQEDLAKISASESETNTNTEAAALTDLAAISGQTQVAVQQAKNQVALSEITNVNSQIGTLLQTNPNFNKAIQAISPTLALELGEGGAASSIQASNSKQAVSTPTTAQTIAGGVSSILGSLFG